MTEIISWDTILEVLGFSVGLLYLWWEYHADSRLWFASIVMPTISMWIYFNKGLYADFSINIYYFVIAIYGYLTWTRNRRRGITEDKSKKADLPITNIPAGNLMRCVGVFALLWGAMYCGLRFLTDSTVPFFTWITRSAMAVRALLWVMIITVMPSRRLITWRSLRIALPVL